MTDDSGIAPDSVALDQALGAARVSVKGVRRDHARAAIADALFGGGEPVEPIGPAKLDRFVIIDKLGRGGMGVVYSAYDPELDRRVAVKVLQSGRQSRDAEARARLLREAQALARLSHPNVVPVHDVGVIDDQVFIVMEFVIGRDLRAWQADDGAGGERSWQQTLGIYLQAGEGLAAAHDAGLVHRDFKPENAIVGADGRVRVLDFGLARAGSEVDPGAGSEQTDTAERAGVLQAEDGEPVSGLTSTMRLAAAATLDDSQSGQRGRKNRDWQRPVSGEYDSSEPLLDVSMTATGAVMGTPAYMSPEQFAGLHVGQATDQFSFCVALYEALYGERPYQGATLAQLGARLLAGEMVEAPRGSAVPGWLLPILRRGLATRPDERYPSMAELLAALRRDPARTRRRWLLLAGALMVAALSAIAASALTRGDGPSAAEPCADAGQVIAQTWNRERRAAVAAAIVTTGHPYAEQAAALVGEKLDAYAEAWAEMRTEACVSHRRGLQSGALLDRRMRCLDRRRDALESAATVLLAPEAENIDKTVLVAEKLPSIEYCSNVEALEAEVPPPEDPEIARQVADLRLTLAQAKAQEDAGGSDRPLAAVNAVVQAARALDYQPLLAEALLAKGRIIMFASERKQSIAPLNQATLVGLRAGVDHVALEALARRMYAEGTTRDDADTALSELPMALVLAERLPDNRFVSALLLNNAGVVANASGDRDTALAHLQKALAYKRELGAESPLELVVIFLNMALYAKSAEERADYARIAQQSYSAALGPNHPRTLEAAVFGSSQIRQLRAAHDLRADACERLLEFHRKQINLITDCLYYSARSHAELGQSERAVQHFATLAGLLVDNRDPYYIYFHQLARGYERFYSQHYESAIAAFERVHELLADPSEQPWWLQSVWADAGLGTAMSALALGDAERAQTLLRRSLPLLQRATEHSTRLELKHLLALARLTLFQSLRARAPAGDSALSDEDRSLAEQARSWYLGDREGHRLRLQQLKDQSLMTRQDLK